MKRVQIGFVIAFFIHAISVVGQDTISWKPAYHLKWTDFKGQIDTTKKYGALSSTGISLKFSQRSGITLFKIVALFYKQESWVRVHSPVGLIHEQGHFNIAEIYARKLRQTLSKYKTNRATVA